MSIVRHVLIAACALIGACSLGAQTIDETRSRFLSAPNARAGTYAPYKLVVNGLDGIETLELRTQSDGVVLTRQVAVAGRESVEVLLPVLIDKSARVQAGEAQHSPRLPLRRVEPDYARPYVAVFSTDPVYARGVLPSAQDGAVCDYYELAEFFTDWRLLDGYDAIVIFNPAELKLPEGSQRAIAEFCSMGGAALVAGSFRLGEKAVDLPAPADAQVQIHRGVTMQRFGYGAGAIYRVSADELRRSPSARDVIVDALRDHMWFGAERAPAGKPHSRAAPERPPLAPPQPPADAAPGALFWALAGGLLLLLVLVPVTFGRYLKQAWPAQLVLAVCGAAVAGAATLQEQPLPVVETSVIVRAGDGDASSTRIFAQVQTTWDEQLTLNLDGEDRSVHRAMPAFPGWRAWVIDMPLSAPAAVRGKSAELRGGMVGEVSFRDFGTAAHRGATEFSTDDAYLVDWWLEGNAYRGRMAELAPATLPAEGHSWAGARTVARGAIRLSEKRVRD